MFTDMDYELEEDKLGIPTVPGTVTLKKDSQNLIGISIGGGAQFCPCLYIVQVFDNTPAALDSTLAAGDEITGVNGKPVKGKTKVEVAKMIQAVQDDPVLIQYNKLQADPKQGKSLDIVLKKVKHRLVENMSSGTADALGLSRAILCNDGLVRRLEELEKTAELYKGLMEHTKRLLRAFYELSQTHRAFGDVFSVIGVREPQAAASEAFVKFAEAHRNMEKFGIQLLKTIKPMLHDLNTYLHKAIPDTKLTIRKYLDVKFEYLSYCLKVKEMDDEEYSCIALGDPLYRVSTGNYEYRLILRCRQEARTRFAKMRKDVLEKIELLDQKHGELRRNAAEYMICSIADCGGADPGTGGVFRPDADAAQRSKAQIHFMLNISVLLTSGCSETWTCCASVAIVNVFLLQVTGRPTMCPSTVRSTI
uniref:PRKCA-binding protein n=1 Tax=Sinocyclocheilus grahami TaxID=75366 RepID=A0A672K8Z6_SINGR